MTLTNHRNSEEAIFADVLPGKLEFSFNKANHSVVMLSLDDHHDHHPVSGESVQGHPIIRELGQERQARTWAPDLDLARFGWDLHHRWIR